MSQTCNRYAVEYYNVINTWNICNDIITVILHLHYFQFKHLGNWELLHRLICYIRPKRMYAHIRASKATFTVQIVIRPVKTEICGGDGRTEVGFCPESFRFCTQITKYSSYYLANTETGHKTTMKIYRDFAFLASINFCCLILTAGDHNLTVLVILYILWFVNITSLLSTTLEFQ